MVTSITDTDTFNAGNYPTLSEELATIAEYTTGMSPVHKEDIIISYLKEGSVKAAWITANPLLTTLVTSSVLPTSTMEALFESSRNHSAFRKDLETFIRERLTKG